jgi:phytoene/squalene synthetase
MEMD